MTLHQLEEELKKEIVGEQEAAAVSCLAVDLVLLCCAAQPVTTKKQ
jgi:hypothetical protein